MDIRSNNAEEYRVVHEVGVKTIPVTEVSINDGQRGTETYTKEAPPIFPNTNQHMNILRSRDVNKANLLHKTTPYSVGGDNMSHNNSVSQNQQQLKSSKSTTSYLRADI